MTDYTEKKCSKCGQRLRIPNDIGGMLMACPSCGEKYHSDFKLTSKKRSEEKEILTTIFNMPYEILRRFLQYFKRSSTHK